MDPQDASADADRIRGLWSELQATRSPDVRNQLVEHYLPMCRRTAATLYARRVGSDTEFVDFLQLASLGLLDAVDRFDPELGVEFESFAYLRVRGSILNGLPQLSERYEQSTLRKRLQLERLESLKQGRGTGPRHDAIGELAQLAIGMVLSYLLEGSGMVAEEPAGRNYRKEFYDDYAHRQIQDNLVRVVDALPPRERRVIRYHYFYGMGFSEISELLGVTKGRVSQIHRQALLLLHEARASLGNMDFTM